jgi:hypothetical protein
MTPEERARRFERQAKAELARLPRIQKDALAEIVHQLTLARRLITGELNAGGSEAGQRKLRQLKMEVERTMEDFRAAATSAATQGAGNGWQAGIESVTQPFEAAGLNLSGPHIDTRTLLASQRFMTDRIEDITRTTVNRLNSTLTQHLIGTRSLSDTITDVGRILGGTPRSRSMTIAYTEIGRVHSIAHQASLDDAGQSVPGLRKRWLQSGKLHPRASHVAAHNQMRKYDEPYMVDGEDLMFPRDPAGSARNTINCGCHSIPVVDGSTFGASTVRIDDAGNAQLQRPDGQRVPLPR